MRVKFSTHKKIYKDLFETENGKAVLHDLCNKFYMTSATIRKGESTEDFLVREGMRQVVLYLLSQVNYDLNKYFEERDRYKMEIEHD